MKITLIREERESGKEAVSTQETDMLMEKLKTENKTGYITELRSIIPHLKGTNARYEHIDRLYRLFGRDVSFLVVHTAPPYLRPPLLRPASSSAMSASTMILRPICVMALSILPLFLMRFAVGMLHPNSRAMPPIPYTYFFSLSAAGWVGFVSLPCKACRFRNMNSSPVICHTGFDKRSLISISE